MKKFLIISIIALIFVGIIVCFNNYIYEDYIIWVNSDAVSIIKYIGKNTEEIAIPEKIKGKNVTKIGAKAFKNNANIKRVYISSSITEIGESAFEGCKNIEFIKILGNEPKIYNNTFEEGTVIKHLYNENKYNDSMWSNYILDEYDIPAEQLTIQDIPDYVYSKGEIVPDITIKYKEKTLIKQDYEIMHVENVNVGKAKVIIKLKGDYIGNIEKEFNIVAKEISELSFQKLSDSNYVGKNITKDVKISDDKYTLNEGTDYTVTYKNNKNVGTATVTIKGVGNYKGTKKLTFKINAINISKVKISGIKSTRIYWQ